MTEKLSFKKITRLKLLELKKAGITKFTSYDILGKKAKRRELSAIQSAIYDLCQDGEIEIIKDSGGNPNKVRPSADITPDYIESKVLLTQYKFLNFGNPTKNEIRMKEKQYKAAAKARVDAVERVVTIWEEVWPELYQVPKFKRQSVAFTNECIG